MSRTVHNPAPALVIFDCDGVLIDSEVAFARALAECLELAGFPANFEEALVLGFGSNRATLAAAVENRYGRPLPDGFFESFGERAHAAFDPATLAMPGVADLLAALPLPVCVASNGHLDRVRRRLQLAGLLDFFEPHVFSASQVPRGKPAPDLFLHAAARFSVAAEVCTVVEDSTVGVAAAVAAGMPVVGFCGGGHCRDEHADLLREAGCTRVFARMPDLARYLGVTRG
jgi:HAD superfamily hydrolase (TIGR01509 family)